MSEGVANQLMQAVTVTAKIIQAIIELLKNRSKKKIEKLNEEIQDLKDDAKKTGKNHNDEIKEKKGQIEKLESEIKKLENINLNDPVYQQMMVNNMNIVLNSKNGRWVQNGALTQEGMNEAANRTVNDIAEHTGIGMKNLEQRRDELVPQMYSENDVTNLANALKENEENVPDSVPDKVKFIFEKLSNKTADDINRNNQIVNKDLAHRINSKAAIATGDNMFYFDKKANSFVSNSIGANPAPTRQHEV